jgi:hypothetical protein
MGYTQRKIRRINRSFFMAALVFAGWALFCAWTGLPTSFPHSGAAGFVLFSLVAVFFMAFPIIWARFPEKHPVLHELHRYGKIRAVSKRLDAEMAGPVEILGPFRFTATLLLYDSAYELQMVPYDQIASAEMASDEGAAAVVVLTHSGRRYQWYSTFMQGRFNAEKVLGKIRAAAHPGNPPKDAQPASGPLSTEARSPSTSD